MVILDELPFSFVEREGFIHFYHVACPLFATPSRRTLSRDLLALYYDEKKKLKEEISAYRICLTTDTWTSIQNINYMVLIAHYIDNDWMLYKKILNFCVIANHKGEIIGKLNEDCLIEWGTDKVLTITVDNATVNDVAVNYVRRKMKTWGKGHVLDGKHLHMRCCAHIINLIVSEGLKDLHFSISSIRNCVRYVRSSPARLATFKTCVEKEKIRCKGLMVLDVPTRWNSTYLMLEVALKFQKAFERMEDEDGHFKSYFIDSSHSREGTPKELDWDNARVFVKFLKSFYEITLRISGSVHATSHTAFHDLFAIQSELDELSSGVEPLLINMAIGMKKKYDKYWSSFENVNQFLLISVVLDPRYKLENLSMHFGELYGDSEKVAAKTKAVRDIFTSLYEFFRAYFTPTNTTTSTSGADSEVTNNSSQTFLSLGEERKRKMREKWARLQKDKDTVLVRNEVDRYLSDACEADVQDFDILNWWKVNGASKYKVLGAIAMDFLAIPVSTVASESCFSTGGRVIDPL